MVIKLRNSESISIDWFDYQYPIKIGNRAKINLGCGVATRDGFVGVDKRDLENVEIVYDLEEFPWPVEDESCSILIAHRLLESIKPWKTIDFFNECWRILEFGGAFVAKTPYAGSEQCYADPNACSFWTIHKLYCFVHGNDFYQVYNPEPWELEEVNWNKDTTMEFILRKVHRVLNVKRDQF